MEEVQQQQDQGALAPSGHHASLQGADTAPPNSATVVVASSSAPSAEVLPAVSADRHGASETVAAQQVSLFSTEGRGLIESHLQVFNSQVRHLPQVLLTRCTCTRY